MTVKKAKIFVHKYSGRNPMALLQDLKNDYRDKKLLPETIKLCRRELGEDIEKKKQGNKYTHAERLEILRENRVLGKLNLNHPVQLVISFVRYFRRKKAEGTLSHDDEKRLKKLGVNLNPKTAYRREQRLRQLKEFVKENNRLPKVAENKGLYNWAHDMIKNLERDKLQISEFKNELMRILNQLPENKYSY